MESLQLATVNLSNFLNKINDGNKIIAHKENETSSSDLEQTRTVGVAEVDFLSLKKYFFTFSDYRKFGNL